MAICVISVICGQSAMVRWIYLWWSALSAVNPCDGAMLRSSIQHQRLLRPPVV